MIEATCDECGTAGQVKSAPKGPVHCHACRHFKEVSTLIDRGLRQHLRDYPIPLGDAKRFYRVVVGIERGFRAYQEDLVTDRCVESLTALGVASKVGSPSAREVEARVRHHLADGVIGSAEQHRLLSDVAYELGDEDAGRIELMIAHCLLRRIEESGNGTKKSPYVVVDVADEYGLLDRQGRGSIERVTHVSRKHNTYYDVHRCSDGTRAWFDVTRQVRARALLNLCAAG